MLHEYLPGSTKERIQALLRENGLTQEHLAQKINISASTLNHYISGQTDKISAENIIAMARKFGVTTDFLLGLTDISLNTNYDIDALGLTADAVSNLLTKQFDMSTLNVLLINPDFFTLVQQLTKLKHGTLTQGAAIMNAIIHTVGSLLKDYVKVNHINAPTLSFII